MDMQSVVHYTIPCTHDHLVSPKEAGDAIDSVIDELNDKFDLVDCSGSDPERILSVSVTALFYIATCDAENDGMAPLVTVNRSVKVASDAFGYSDTKLREKYRTIYLNCLGLQLLLRLDKQWSEVDSLLTVNPIPLS
jgi:hypothetical protein